MSADEVPERKFNVLLYGIERKGLPIPAGPQQTRNFTAHFEKFDSPRRFNEFDGVVVFQGIFERFEWKTGYMDSYLEHHFERDELDKRKKEAALLLGQGGFLCFILTDQFIDRDDRRDFSGTDLAKHHLNYLSFYRENLKKRVAQVAPVLDEFKRFLDVYGAASTFFKNHNNSLDVKELVRVGSMPVGLLVNQAEYFIPSLVPDPRPEVIEEYVHLLLDALTSVHSKLHQAVPEWVSAYRFEEEERLVKSKQELLDQVREVEARLSTLARYKAALVHTGPELVADVSAILEAALGAKVDAADEFREDIKILDASGKTIAVCEVKGVNRGVKREHINQADSHRERSGFGADFPAWLVVNTSIKTSRTVAEKDQEIADEQVKHAAHMRVLVVRTLDLLGVLRLVLSGVLKSEHVAEVMLKSTGWLRVDGDELQIRR